MTWSLGYPEIKNTPATEAVELLKKSPAPRMIVEYVEEAISGLVMIHGEDVTVSVTGFGHLCDGANSYERSTATVEVRKGD